MSTERQNQFGKHCAHMRDTPNKKYVHKCRTNSHHHTPHQMITFNRNTPIQKSYALAVCRNSLKQKRIYVYINDLTLFLKYMCIEAGHCGVCEKKMLRYARLECVYGRSSAPRARDEWTIDLSFLFFFSRIFIMGKNLRVFFSSGENKTLANCVFSFGYFCVCIFYFIHADEQRCRQGIFLFFTAAWYTQNKNKIIRLFVFFLLLLCKYLSRLMRLPRPKVSGIKHARNEYTKKMFFYNMNWQ